MDSTLPRPVSKDPEAGMKPGSSMERDPQPEIVNVVFPSRFQRGATFLEIAVRAEIEVADRRDRDVRAHADVVAQSHDKPVAGRLGGAAIVEPGRGEPHATFDEEPRLRLWIQIAGERDVPELCRHPACRLRPGVDLTAEQHLVVERTAELDEPCAAAFAARRAAAIAAHVARPVAEAEPDPEPLADLGMLCCTDGRAPYAEHHRYGQRAKQRPPDRPHGTPPVMSVMVLGRFILQHRLPGVNRPSSHKRSRGLASRPRPSRDSAAPTQPFSAFAGAMSTVI